MSRSGRYFLALQEERKWHNDMDEKAEARFRERYLRGLTTTSNHTPNEQQAEPDKPHVDRADQQVPPDGQE